MGAGEFSIRLFLYNLPALLEYLTALSKCSDYIYYYVLKCYMCPSHSDVVPTSDLCL